MHPIVKLAKASVEQYVKNGNTPDLPDSLPEEMLNKAGVFVCLKVNGQLRGCIGTIEPVTDCVAQEAVRNAVAAAVSDPRFLPVGQHELNSIEYAVDVLCPAEKVAGTSELDPIRYGVIVRKGRRKGLLLPDIEGVDSADAQVSIARAKAGIAPDDKDVEIYRFEVRRFK
ncbi:MAG: AmmeMemoRadiSam system protein A [Actinomycetota bacterium]|nr:AmmeMemoRadiSam system protein A [Actinomycetota bacterium]